MENVTTRVKRVTEWIRDIARILTIMWAGGGVGILVYSLTLFREGWFLVVEIGLCLIFLAGAMIPWRWELIGGILLLAVSSFLVVLNFVVRLDITSLLLVVLPPFIAGFLFITSWWKLRASVTSEIKGARTLRRRVVRVIVIIVGICASGFVALTLGSYINYRMHLKGAQETTIREIRAEPDKWIGKKVKIRGNVTGLWESEGVVILKDYHSGATIHIKYFRAEPHLSQYGKIRRMFVIGYVDEKGFIDATFIEDAKVGWTSLKK